MELVVIIVLLLLLFIMTFVQGIYSYMLGTVYVSRADSVTAIFWLQYISYDKLFVLNGIIIIIISMTVIGVNIIVPHCHDVPT